MNSSRALPVRGVGGGCSSVIKLSGRGIDPRAVSLGAAAEGRVETKLAVALHSARSCRPSLDRSFFHPPSATWPLPAGRWHGTEAERAIKWHSTRNPASYFRRLPSLPTTPRRSANARAKGSTANRAFSLPLPSPRQPNVDTEGDETRLTRSRPNRHLLLARARRWVIRRTFLLMQGLQRRGSANPQPSGDPEADGPSNGGTWALDQGNGAVRSRTSWSSLPWELKLEVLRRVTAWMDPICRHLVCREWRGLLSRAPDESASGGGGGPETIDATPAAEARKVQPRGMRHKDVRDALVAEAPLSLIRWMVETMCMHRLCVRRSCEVAAFWGRVDVLEWLHPLAMDELQGGGDPCDVSFDICCAAVRGKNHSIVLWAMERDRRDSPALARAPMMAIARTAARTGCMPALEWALSVRPELIDDTNLTSQAALRGRIDVFDGCATGGVRSCVPYTSTRPLPDEQTSQSGSGKTVAAGWTLSPPCCWSRGGSTCWSGR